MSKHSTQSGGSDRSMILWRVIIACTESAVCHIYLVRGVPKLTQNLGDILCHPALQFQLRVRVDERCVLLYTHCEAISEKVLQLLLVTSSPAERGLHSSRPRLFAYLSLILSSPVTSFLGHVVIVLNFIFINVA